MDIQDLRNKVYTNSIPNFLIFGGKEQFLCKHYITHISTTLNKHYKYYDTLEQVLHEASINIKEDFLYIVLNDKDALKNGVLIESAKSIGRNIILYYTDIDTFSQSLNDNVVMFNPLDSATILAFLNKRLREGKVEVSIDLLQDLIEKCGNDLGCCVNEIDKIIALGFEKSNKVTSYMLNNGFSDFRDVQASDVAYKLLQNDHSVLKSIYKLGTSPISLLYIIYSMALKRLGGRDSARYVNILNKCFEIDCGIKDGTINSKHVIDYILLSILY